ncbi:DUF429 domain-containing protein [Pseudidiomarina mangrovi]|uniref:DUF429 domain-containing protein n=1 Tax=Pseudidiomarina mangrovi TaxID=2487133 RepID=UPI0013DF873B|nr:DUF429 domain-containing protein [Pseudidiomarina mangrovi]
MTAIIPSRRIAGIDIAWRDGNPSALAIGELEQGVLQVEQLLHDCYSAPEMGQILLAEAVHGVAIDGPTVIVNATGMRDCERAIASRYGRRGVACYPANLNLWAHCQSLQLSQWLLQRGFGHAGSQPERVDHAPWQIECYPHAALLELLQLPYRLAYKKGSSDARRSGQQHFAELLMSLTQPAVTGAIQLRLAATITEQYLNTERIASLRGAALKANDDCLDALVCVLIAAYHQQQQSEVFGDDQHGFIVVPMMTSQCPYGTIAHPLNLPNC